MGDGEREEGSKGVEEERQTESMRTGGKRVREREAERHSEREGVKGERETDRQTARTLEEKE